MESISGEKIQNVISPVQDVEPPDSHVSNASTFFASLTAILKAFFYTKVMPFVSAMAGAKGTRYGIPSRLPSTVMMWDVHLVIFLVISLCGCQKKRKSDKSLLGGYSFSQLLSSLCQHPKSVDIVTFKALASKCIVGTRSFVWECALDNEQCLGVNRHKWLWPETPKACEHFLKVKRLYSHITTERDREKSELTHAGDSVVAAGFELALRFELEESWNVE